MESNNNPVYIAISNTLYNNEYKNVTFEVLMDHIRSIDAYINRIFYYDLSMDLVTIFNEFRINKYTTWYWLIRENGTSLTLDLEALENVSNCYSDRPYKTFKVTCNLEYSLFSLDLITDYKPEK